MKATKENIDQFKPGMWYSVCCIEDLYQADEEDVKDFKEDFWEEEEDKEYHWLMFWPTKEEAIKELYTDDTSDITKERLGINQQIKI